MGIRHFRARTDEMVIALRARVGLVIDGGRDIRNDDRQKKIEPDWSSAGCLANAAPTIRGYGRAGATPKAPTTICCRLGWNLYMGR